MCVLGWGGCQEPYTLDFIILHVINLNIYFIRVYKLSLRILAYYIFLNNKIYIFINKNNYNKFLMLDVMTKFESLTQKVDGLRLKKPKTINL